MADVSVIMPAYNAAATVVSQLSALDRQTFSGQMEVIVSDNGSTDDTVRVVREWASEADWLTVIDASRRRGPSVARNAGAVVASAPLLLFCDADDVVDDRWIEMMVLALAEADVVGGYVDTEDSELTETASVSWITRAPITLPFWPEFAAGASNNLGIRATVFQKIGGFDESLTAGEDIDLCWRAQMDGCTFVVSDSAMVKIRKRVGLSAVARQAFSYGQGEALLRRKHAAAARKYQAGIAQSLVEPRSFDRAVVRILDQVRGGSRRALRVGSRLWLPQQQADIVWRCGHWLGLRSDARQEWSRQWRRQTH